MKRSFRRLPSSSPCSRSTCSGMGFATRSTRRSSGDSEPRMAIDVIDAPRIGVLPAGERDSIADVPGVTVGHATLADGPVQTGVTVVRPHPGDLYQHPIPAAAVVINGFGKTAGLVQLNELGTLESPIALTN